MMRRCPDAGLLLDTGHLAVAGGDALRIDPASRYYDRLVAVHLKCWVMQDKDAPEWYKRGYFTGLDYVPTEPNAVYVPNAEVVALLKSRGFDKWIMVRARYSPARAAGGSGRKPQVDARTWNPDDSKI